MVERRTVEHVYLSTACLHGEHGYCQAVTGRCGSKTPAVCKFCSAPCVCRCHAPESGRERSPTCPNCPGPTVPHQHMAITRTEFDRIQDQLLRVDPYDSTKGGVTDA